MQAIAELSGRSCYICCGLVGVARFVHAQARTRRQGKQALHTRRGLLTVLRALRKRGSRDAPPLCVAARAAAIEAAPLLPKHHARHLRTERFTRSRRRSVGRPEACTARAHARHEGHSQGGMHGHRLTHPMPGLAPGHARRRARSERRRPGWGCHGRRAPGCECGGCPLLLRLLVDAAAVVNRTPPTAPAQSPRGSTLLERWAAVRLRLQQSSHMGCRKAAGVEHSLMMQ